MSPRSNPAAASASAWYRQPVLWLGVAVFIASLAGCVWMVVLGVRHADTPLPTSHQIFDVPVSARSLSGFGGRGENSAVRGQISDALPAHSGAMDIERWVVDRTDGFAARPTKVRQAPGSQHAPR
ncbi:MAG: hypothetical protein ACYCZD_05615 [Rhodanobacter sp.]